MASPTNLTDRISHLRDRREGSPVIKGESGRPPSPARPARRPAADFFMIFAYALLAIALACQVALILSLDIG